MKHRKLLVHYFLSTLVVLVIAGLLAEMFVRYRHKGKNLELIHVVTEERHVPKPYVMFTAKPGLQYFDDRIYGRVNSLGYLGPLPTVKKPKSEYRIFFLGGSTMFQGVPAFPRLLEKKFEQAGAPVKVFNFSVVSSVSRQELVRILIDIGSYEPDLIVSFTGQNDLYDTGWDPRINYPHRFILFEANPALKLKVEDYQFFPVLALGTQIGRDYFSESIFESLAKGILPPNMKPRNEKRPLIVSAFFQNLRLSKELSRLFGAEYQAYLQPNIFFKNQYGPVEQRFVTEYISRVILPKAKGIRALVNAEAAKHSDTLDFTDLSDFFQDKDGDIFTDSVHFADQRGHEALAEYFYKRFEEIVKRPKRLKPVLIDLLPEESFL